MKHRIEVVAWIEHDSLDAKSGPPLAKQIKAALEPFGEVRACWVHNWHARRAGVADGGTNVP
jgi:hypothetical protein